LVALVAWGVWFHFTSARPLPEPAAVHPAAPAAVPSVSRGAPPPRLTTEDGARMRLVPGGEVRLPDGSKKAVAPFYLDETLVTNHQYVEFLNAMLPHLRVEGDRVKLGGEVLLRLGQVRQGVEPIVFRNGRFHLQDPSLAAHPVVRVTGFGAAAYAAHYRKRLPTPGQWLRAREGGAAVPSRVAPQDPMAAMHARMAAPVAPAPREDYAPVTQSPPNRYGIRGLGGPVGEWLQGQDGRNDRERFWVAPGSRTAAAGNLQPQSPREAFATVGFRCARPVPSGQSPEPGRAGKE
jgi:serine/threonine-protein kinase